MTDGGDIAELSIELDIVVRSITTYRITSYKRSRMLILYFLFFSVWLYSNYRRYKFTPSTFLLGIYWLSSLAAQFLLYGYKTYSESRIELSAIIFHIICLFLFLYPLIRFGNENIIKFRLPSLKYIKIFSWFIIALSVIAIIVAAYKVKFVFSFSDLTEARRLHNAGELYDRNNGDFFDYIANIGPHLALFALFMSFYVFAFYPRSKKLFILLFISSFSIVLGNLAILGRDGIIRWFLFFFFVYSYFKRYLLRKTKRLIRFLFILVGLPIILIFFKITDVRFTGRDEGLFYYLIDYTGQSFIYFSYNFNRFIEGTSGGRMNFPILFPSSERAQMGHLNDIYMADYNLNTFSTFVGSFYFDMGLTKTLFLAISFFLFFLLFFKRRKTYSFTKLIVFLILYEVVLLGVFYYMFSSPTVINTFILLICIAVFIVFNEKYFHKNSKKRKGMMISTYN